MAKPIGIASGLVALATFAFQSSITLFDLVQSYQSHPKRVRDLIEELGTLSGVLSTLRETVNANTDTNLDSLGYPLLRCGNACKNFEEELKKCSTRSRAGKTSFRDWAKLKYMGEDIDGFRRMLAAYKSTIIIALTDANLRQSSIVADSLESYNEIIETTTDDLETHLESIDEKLEKIIANNARDSNTDASEIQLIEEERLSTQKCLEICAQLSSHIDQIQQLQKARDNFSDSISSSSVPNRVTNKKYPLYHRCEARESSRDTNGSNCDQVKDKYSLSGGHCRTASVNNSAFNGDKGKRPVTTVLVQVISCGQGCQFNREDPTEKDPEKKNAMAYCMCLKRRVVVCTRLFQSLHHL